MQTLTLYIYIIYFKQYIIIGTELLYSDFQQQKMIQLEAQWVSHSYT